VRGMSCTDSLVVVSFLVVVGCGGGNPASSLPRQTTSHRAVLAARTDRTETIPKRCSPSANECLPPAPWVHKLCDGVHPDVALYLFHAGTPWQRFYMLARAKPYNASGGVSLLGESLEYGEEVIALRRRDNQGGIQVGDSAGYDVLRWNGACVTVHDGDFTSNEPRRKGHSRVEWRYLSDELQQALTADPAVTATYRDPPAILSGGDFGYRQSRLRRFGSKADRRDRSLRSHLSHLARARGGEVKFSGLAKAALPAYRKRP